MRRLFAHAALALALALSLAAPSAQALSPGARLVVVGRGLQPETRAILAAMTERPSGPRIAAYDTLMRDIKAAGLLARGGVLTITAAHSNQAATLNLLNPAKVWTPTMAPGFVVDRGFTGNGTDAFLQYADNLSAVPNYTLNDASLAGWECGNVDAATALVGAQGGTNARVIPLSGGNASVISNTAAGDSAAVAAATGFTGWSRADSASYTAYKADQVLGTFSRATTSIPTGRLVALRSSGTYSTRTVAVVWAGASLTTQWGSLYRALRRFLPAAC